VSDDEDNANNNSEDCESYKSSEDGYVKNIKLEDENESVNLDVLIEKFQRDEAIVDECLRALVFTLVRLRVELD
jgi:hypothetical protein